MDEFLSLSLMFMLAIECDQNVRTFWLCFTLNDQPVVEEPVSAGPEMKTHFTYMFYSNLHLTVSYTIHYLTPRYTLYYLTPYTTLYLILPYTQQEVY